MAKVEATSFGFGIMISSKKKLGQVRCAFAAELLILMSFLKIGQ